MWSVSLAWHIVWFARVTLSLVLFLVIIKRQLYKQFPLFSVYAGWISVAGTTLVVMNYLPSVSGNQYFVGVAISNGIAAALAFTLIYRIFIQRLNDFPPVRDLGSTVFRVATLIVLIAAIAIAWFVPGRVPAHLISAYTVVQRTVHTLQCGQLVFVFLFCGYFRLSWRSPVFGIALGLGILSSTSLAINALHSQVTDTVPHTEYVFLLANDSTYLLSVMVWLFYLLAPDQSPQLTNGPLPPHDLETWNQELERLLEP
jgi:hypothetical protein